MAAPEDTKMKEATEDATVKDEAKAAVETTTKTGPKDPPLVAAAWRLERVLSDRIDYIYNNPYKVVRRWLGTSSGAAGDATMADVQAAAKVLLESSDSPGRDLLLQLPANDDGSAMDTTTTEASATSDEKEPKYLTTAAREVESWLIALAVRLLYHAKSFEAAYKLAQAGIDLTSDDPKSSAMYPLLARLYRWRSTVAEALPNPPALRTDLAQAHNLATRRRDVDTQATLLNAMLRDMLAHSQSTLTCCDCSNVSGSCVPSPRSHTTHLSPQSNKRKSSFPTRPFQSLPPTISSVVSFTTREESRRCAWNTRQPLGVCPSASARHPPIPALVL